MEEKKEEDYSSESMEEDLPSKSYEELMEEKDLTSLTLEDKNELVMAPEEDRYRGYIFHNLRKYIQLDTDEYIPMKISVEVEDPVVGKKVRELVRALETTRAPEQFFLNKKEMDEDAYFAEGYGLRMNDDQRKKHDEFFWGRDVEGLKKLLRKEKLYSKSIFNIEEYKMNYCLKKKKMFKKVKINQLFL